MFARYNNKILLHMDKIDLGKYTVATKWEDVTLGQWQDYIKLINESENKEVDILTTLQCFSNIPRNVIYQIPTDLFNKIILNLKWINEEPDTKPSNKIEIDNEVYQINVMNKLKVKEYLDLNTLLENDKYNYAGILAILCRKDNEEYDEEYIADKWSERAEMFDKMSIVKIFPLISFFLLLWNESEIHSRNSSIIQDLKQILLEQVKNIKSSLSLMDYITPFRVQQILTLQKLEKSLKNI